MHSGLKRKLKELHRLQSKIDELTRQKNELRSEVTELIRDERQIGRGFQIGDRYICYRKKEVTGGLTQAYVAQSLYRYFNGGREAQNLFRYLMENRPVTEKYALEMSKKPKK